jgi:diguanylate cyclase (GGDEF)-like protein
VRDVSEARQQAEKLVTLARTDSLTGLPNRHWLNDYLPDELQRARMMGNRLALIYFDLDHFKNINDALGYRVGDEVLQAVGESLRAALRGDDQLARTGGDEFTVVVKNLEQDAADVVRRIAEHLLDRLLDLGTGTTWRMFTMKASVGISLFPDHGADLDSLLRAADIAMYEAKAQGRGQVQYYAPSFAARIRERIEIEHALTQAIRNDDFTLVYQPRVDASSGRLCATEALLRWQHPERGVVEPWEFISLAEQTGQIVQIGDLVIRKVCAQIAAWRSAGRVVRPVSINVSARQLRTAGLCQTLSSYLAEYKIPASLIAIELTESSVLDEGGVAQEELRNLRRMGVALEIDDFGTGYSSLSKLQSLEIDALKIDRSFVQRLGSDEQTHTLCATIVSIGRSLHITVVAEGVERPDQLAALQRMGCDQVQGYQIAAPMAAEQVPGLIDRVFFPARRRIVKASGTARAISPRSARTRRRIR